MVDLPEGVACSLTLAGYVGDGLKRPECVLVERAGGLVVSDMRGGVTRIGLEGTCRHFPCPGGTSNGIAMDRDGTLYLAGIDSGTIHAMQADGTARLLLDAFDGKALGAVNFVHFDPVGGLWVTISTRTQPRSRAIDEPIPDGYILKLASTGPQLMSSGHCFANELRFDPAMRFAYLAESRMGRVVRMPVTPGAVLGPPEAFGPDPLFNGAIVDGLAFDSEGGLWVTEITRNGIHRIDSDGQIMCLFEDPEAKVIDFPASIAFGGPDRKTVFVGSIRMDRVLSLRSPIAGSPMWHEG